MYPEKCAGVFCAATEILVQGMQLKWGKHLSEPFHVTNALDKRGIESILVFRWFIH